MDVLPTRIDPSSEAFRANADAMQTAVDAFRARVEVVHQGGGERARAKHEARGKLLVRDRIARLVDPDSPFVELSALAAHGLYDDDAPCAGIVTGLGRIEGRVCVIVANDATVKGGIVLSDHGQEASCARRKSRSENHLPCIYLVDSGGAFLPLQDGGISRQASTSVASSTTRRA